MLNRSALILRVRQPFLDWARSLPGDADVLPSFHDEHTVYLIPPMEDPRDLEMVLREGWREWFRIELEAWHTAESDWPAERTYEMFRAWFDTEVHSTVVDVCEGPLIDEEGRE